LGAAVAGVLPVGVRRYAYWHVWVAGSAVGFVFTGATLRDTSFVWRVCLIAALTEVVLLVIAFVEFGFLLPGLYVILAVTHATPLVLDGVVQLPTVRFAVPAQVLLYAVAFALLFL